MTQMFLKDIVVLHHSAMRCVTGLLHERSLLPVLYQTQLSLYFVVLLVFVVFYRFIIFVFLFFLNYTIFLVEGSLIEDTWMTQLSHYSF